MLLFVYTATHKSFVIFTCRYFKLILIASFNVLSGYFLFGGGFHWFNFNKFLDTDPSRDLRKPSQKIQIFVFHSRADSAQ